MKVQRVVALVAGALVAGLTLGWAATGIAATVAPTPASQGAPCGTGLRLGDAMRESGSRLLDIVAKLTGLSTDEVVAERQAGKTYAEIAASKNVSADAVVNEAVAARQAAVAAAVAAGTITQEQADAALAQMQDRMTDRLQSTNVNCSGEGAGSCGAGNGGMMRRGGGSCDGSGQRMGGQGMGGQACGGACAVTQ